MCLLAACPLLQVTKATNKRLSKTAEKDYL
jgi:hypothetical protein